MDIANATSVRQALSARGSDPEMEYAAALMTCDRANRGLSDKHLRLALAGAREGSGIVAISAPPLSQAQHEAAVDRRTHL